MRRIFITCAALIAIVSACSSGGSTPSNVSPTTTPPPTGCPPQTIMTINGSASASTEAAATRKAVTKKNTITVYLFTKLLDPKSTDFAELNGANFRLDGTAAIIAEGKITSGATVTAGTYTTGGATQQLTGYSVQQSGTLLTQQPTKPPSAAKMTISSISSTLVCGSIEGPNGSATFIADRINASK